MCVGRKAHHMSGEEGCTTCVGQKAHHVSGARSYPRRWGEGLSTNDSPCAQGERPSMCVGRKSITCVGRKALHVCGAKGCSMCVGAKGIPYVWGEKLPMCVGGQALDEKLSMCAGRKAVPSVCGDTLTTCQGRKAGPRVWGVRGRRYGNRTTPTGGVPIRLDRYVLRGGLTTRPSGRRGR